MSDDPLQMTAAALLIAVDLELEMDLLHCCNLYFLQDRQYLFPFEHLKYDMIFKFQKMTKFQKISDTDFLTKMCPDGRFWAFS